MAVAGLEQKIRQNLSIAYTIPLCIKTDELINKALASSLQKLSFASEDDKDLYKTKSILVSTNWNKNSDVFSPEEVWKARNTPSHKPTKLEHDEHQLVGHITNTWAIDEDGKIIADDTSIEDLPSLYHIVNGAVIYMVWEDEALKDRASTLIEEIEAEEKYVSMECLFNDFDYAVMNEDGESPKVIARNEDTAWLTKHLRQYGGTGYVDGKAIGRLLKNITFCGKGYVNKPANPNSIIFSVASLNRDSRFFDFSKASHQEEFEDSKVKNENSGVSSNSLLTEGVNMSDILVKEKEKLEAKVEALQADLLKAQETVAKSNIASLEQQIADLKAENSKATETIEAKDKELSTAQEELKTLQAEKVKTDEAKAKLEKELEEVRASELEAKRVAMLVDGGIDKADASAKVKLFANLNDEQFEVLAKELVEAKKKKEKYEKDEEDDDDDASGSDDDSDVDDSGEASASGTNVEPESEPNLSGEDDTDAEALALRKEIASLLGKSEDKE